MLLVRVLPATSLLLSALNQPSCIDRDSNFTKGPMRSIPPIIAIARPSVIAALLGLAILLGFGTQANAVSHKITPGDSLWSISTRYGCQLESLMKANRLRKNIIYPGKSLALPPTCTKLPAFTTPRSALDNAPKDRLSNPPLLPNNGGAKNEGLNKGTHQGKVKNALVRYRVTRGDTLIALSQRYSTSVSAIQSQNGLGGNLIRIGQVIRIPAHRREARFGSALKQLDIRPVHTLIGQSIGRASHGRLVRPSVLAPDNAFYIRRPHRAFGTLHMVENIRQVARLVKARHPKAHKLSVGDLSAKGGGKISHHVSHQSGRDVDLGFYFTRKPRGYPKTFITATAANLNFAATWTMLRSFADTADDKGGVYMMFLDYDVQKMLYDWARERGVARSVLHWMFQYPRGRHVREGLIRHEPGHAGHVHVRFKCAPKDKSCD